MMGCTEVVLPFFKNSNRRSREADRKARVEGVSAQHYRISGAASVQNLVIIVFVSCVRGQMFMVCVCLKVG